MPEGGWDPKAALDQVTNAEHPNEALEETGRNRKFRRRKTKNVYRSTYFFFNIVQFKTHHSYTTKMHSRLQFCFPDSLATKAIK